MVLMVSVWYVLLTIKRVPLSPLGEEDILYLTVAVGIEADR